MAELHQIDNTSQDAPLRDDEITAGATILTAQGLSFSYIEASCPVLSQADFTLNPGQVTLLLGRSGSGKTTLLRCLKPILRPQGEMAGQLSFLGKDMDKLSSQEAVAEIGFLFQNPEAQLVMDTVYKELAFGLENLGLPAVEIQARIADTVSFCGMEHLLSRKTADLSGGQKQLVNLCALLCFRPKLLLLDEPFSQLDPESTWRVVEILQRLRRETAVAILISEQRLEDLWSLADQVIKIDQGKISFVGSPRDFVNFSWRQQDDFGLPLVSKIFAKSGQDLSHLPLTVPEGKSLLAAWEITALINTDGKEPVVSLSEKKLGPIVFQGREISFAYPGGRDIILRQISLQAHQGERLVICGSNGAGKTTLLKTMAGILKPLQGKWQLQGKADGISYLSQTSQYHFRYDTPHQEFLVLDPHYQENAEYRQILEQLGVAAFLQEDLYTLSAGQQQRVALCMALARPAAVYILDEPTRGLDEENKAALKEILCGKKDSALILATHDLEFAAAVGTSFTTLCHGALSKVQSGADFFLGRYWQTTVGGKLFGELARECGWYNGDNIPESWGACHEVRK
ncbi:MAG: ATP-binding cassette domain-containing protein [Peptococcaceae bacterium]|jgi:energy-coupling factor transporter ATP-binding protein EcfA2|nr:ATP-binding cassette domain-containing protein [Peptococcaceae bacterium]